jgi:hypothetical protein
MKLPLLLILSLVANSSLAHVEDSHFPGTGFHWYDSVCGYACYNALASAALSCSSEGSTSVACQASDSDFLKSLAYCMDSACDVDNVSIWEREKFWAATFMPMKDEEAMHGMVMGDTSGLPVWGYTDALSQVSEAPVLVFNSRSKDVFNQTMLVSKADYEKQSRFIIMFDHLEALQAKYI